MSVCVCVWPCVESVEPNRIAANCGEWMVCLLNVYRVCERGSHSVPGIGKVAAVTCAMEFISQLCDGLRPWVSFACAIRLPKCGVARIFLSHTLCHKIHQDTKGKVLISIRPCQNDGIPFNICMHLYLYVSVFVSFASMNWTNFEPLAFRIHFNLWVGKKKSFFPSPFISIRIFLFRRHGKFSAKDDMIWVQSLACVCARTMWCTVWLYVLGPMRTRFETLAR